MRYLIFNTRQQAVSRSEQQAVALGCEGDTKAWWDWRETADGRWALLVDDDTPGAVIDEPEWLVSED
ncbi:hypothetical protein [Hydrocarboniphaga effusa]|uniref:hypothetical protein n=1 Tax=Hydrocarboniphaga effusa TaxID=243629 RepID=UPI003BA9023F